MKTMPLPNPLLDEDPPWWRMYLDPRGRICRRQFWLHGVLAPMAAALVLNALLGIARVEPGSAENLVNLALLWPIVVTSCKRWHDCDKATAWVLVTLVPLVGWLWALAYNGFVPGTRGPNRFGPDPLATRPGDPLAMG